MTLTETQLNDFLGVLERIDQGKAMPNFPDRMGRFLRQYQEGRLRLSALCRALGEVQRRDGAISGSYLGTAEVHPLAEISVGVLGFPLGEVADTIGISEELGGVVNVVMWLKGPMANAAYEILKGPQAIRLEGDYRWTPTSRFAIGGATVDPINHLVWRESRCIKAAADDLDRPPHALEFVLDYRLGSPGIKFFRSTCVLKRGPLLMVLPGFVEPMPLQISGVQPRAFRSIADGSVLSLLMYQQPWDSSWAIVDWRQISVDEAFSHVVTWADYQLELSGGPLDSATVATLRKSFGAAGLPLSRAYVDFNTERRLLPIARDAIKELRRL